MTNTFRVQRLVAILSAGVVVSALGQGCGCPGPVGPDGGTDAGTATITFIAPVDGDTLNPSDDDDPLENNIQFDVEVDYSGSDGRVLTLTSSEGEEATATVSNGSATFNNFDIAASSGGTEQTLTVSDTLGASAEITVTGVEPDGSTTCTFNQPTSGAMITTDADPNTDGAQIDFDVTCSGEDPNNHDLVVNAGDVDVTATTNGSGNATGQVTVGNNMGMNTVRADLVDDQGNLIATVAISVTVQVNPDFPCAATFASPLDGDDFTADSIDASPDIGFQTEVTIDTGNIECAGVSLDVTVDGITESGTIGADGTGNVVVTLPEGNNVLLTSRVYDDDGNENIANISVDVDTLPPSVTLTSPLEGETFDETDDLDGDALNGITLEFAGTTVDTTEATYEITCSGTGAPFTDNGDITLNVDGSFTIQVENISKPQCTLIVTVSDGSQDEMIEVHFTVNLPQPCAADIVSPPDGTVYGAMTTDADPGSPGLQIPVVINPGNNPACATWTGSVEVGGNTYGPATVSNGTMTVNVTVPEGDSTLTATVSNSDGTTTSNVGDNTVNVTVDTMPPVVAITYPVEDATYDETDDLDADPLNLIDLAFTGSIMGATMASYDVTCNGNSGDQSGTLPAGAFDTSLTGLDQGDCTATITATDGINTVMVPVSFHIVVDLPCEATITSPADGALFGQAAVDTDPITPGFQTTVAVDTNNAAFCEGFQVDIDTGASTYSGFVNSQGTAFIQVTLADGDFTLTASVTDGVRTSTLGDNQVDVSVDRTAPLLSVTSPVDGQFYGPGDDLDANPANGTTLNLTGNATGATSASYDLACDGGGNFNLSGMLALDGAGNFTLPLTNIDQPNCTLTVQATDGVNTTTQVLTFTIGDVSLSVSVAGDADGNGWWVASEDAQPATPTELDAQVSVTASFTVGTYTARIEVVRVSDGAVVFTDDLGTVASGVAATTTISVAYSDATQYQIRAYVDDGATETGPANAQFRVDTVAPSFNVSSPVQGLLYGNAADANAGINGYQQLAYTTVTGLAAGAQVTITYTGPATVGRVCVLASGVCTNNTANLTDGAWVATFSATDAAGNSGTAVRNFSVDSSLPNVNAITVVEDGAPVGVFNGIESGDPPGAAVSNVTVTFNDINNGRTITLRIDGTQVATGVTAGNSVTFTNVALPEGNHTLSVQGTDSAGNGFTGNTSLALLVDTVAPNVSIAVPSKPTLLVADDKDPVTQAGLQIDIVVTTNAGATQTVELFDGASSLGTAPVAGGQAVFADITLADGAHNLTAVVSDVAGNTSTSAPYTPTVDSVGPSLTITAPAADAVFMAADDADPAKSGFQLDVTVDYAGLSAGRTIAIIDQNNLQRGTTTVGADSGTEVIRINVPYVNGEITSLRARGTETSGNVGTSQPVSIQVNTGEYSVLLTSPDQVAGMIEIGAADDIGGGTARFEISVNGWTAAPMPTTITVLVDGLATTATITEMGDTIWVDLPVTDGDSGTIEITFADGDAMGGTTGEFNYNVDFGAPTVTIASITDGQGTVNNPVDETFNIASDLNEGLAGLQVQVTVDVTQCENGTITLQEGGTDLATAQGPVDGSGTDSVTVTVTDTSENTADWVATCTDLAGNSGSGAVQTTVDITAPAVPALTTAVIGNPRLGQIEVSTTAAPGDDGAAGGPVTVTVVASRSPITEADVAALAAGEPYPSFGGRVAPDANPTPGGAFSVTSQFLAYDNTWYFGVLSVDDVGNTSFATVSEAGLVTSMFTYANVDNDVAAGAAERDYFGGVPQVGGDFNGDGFNDIAVAAWNEGDNCTFPFYCHGSVRIFGGGGDLGSLSVGKTLDETNVGGTANLGYLGVAVADLDGDSRDDLIVTAVDPTTFYGELHIFYGTNVETVPGVPDLVETTPVVIDLQSLSIVGVQPRNLGDVDGDGFDDIGITAWDAFYAYTTDYVVLFGSGTRPTTGAIGTANGSRYALLDNDRPQGGAAETPLLGVATGVGNLNADAYDDFVVDGHDGFYVIHGKATGDWAVPPATESLALLAATDVIACTASGCGRDLAAGDVDGDGDQDLVASQAPNVAIYKANGGALSATADYNLSFTQPLAFQVNSNVAVQDTNGDGYDDVMVLYFAQAAEPAKVTVWLGYDYAEGSGLTGGARTEPDAIYPSTFDGFYAGFASACGDLDNDGLDELCWATERADNGAGQGDGSLFVRY